MLPELARRIVAEDSAPDALVVDPMAGIGTTLVEADGPSAKNRRVVEGEEHLPVSGELGHGFRPLGEVAGEGVQGPLGVVAVLGVGGLAQRGRGTGHTRDLSCRLRRTDRLPDRFQRPGRVADLELEAQVAHEVRQLRPARLADGPGNTPLSLWSAARAALWARDIEKARVARAAMDLLHGRWIENCRRTVDTGIAALEGHIDDAVTGYAGTLDTWSAMNLPLDHVYCTIDAATLLPEEAEAVAEARTHLEQLGAKPLLERLSASVPSAAPTQ